jgi:hypothetical protein
LLVAVVVELERLALLMAVVAVLAVYWLELHY